MKTRTQPQSSCCGCPVFSDNFDRPNQVIQNRTADSSGNWSVANAPPGQDDSTPKWEIKGNELMYPSASSGASNSLPIATWSGEAPLSWLVSVDVGFATNGGKVRIMLNSHPNNWAVELEAATDKIGYMSLVKNPLGDLEVWDWKIPIPQLFSGLGSLRHKVTMCYSPATDVLVCSVTNSVNGITYYHHVKNPGAQQYGELSAIKFSLWVDRTQTGDYHFDNFKVEESRSKSGQDEYGYGYGEENECPCCGKGCSEVNMYSDTVNGDQWSRISGTWTSSYNPALTKTSSSNAKLIWQGSWHGIGDDCVPDSSYLIRASILEPSGDYDYSIVAFIGDEENGYASAVLSVDVSDGITHNLKVYDFEGNLISEDYYDQDDNYKPTGLILCYDGYDLTALGGFCSTTGFVQSPNSNAMKVGIGTGDISEEIKFDMVKVSHNLLSDKCPDCWYDLGDIIDRDGPHCGLCEDRTPQFIMVSLDITNQTTGNPDFDCAKDFEPFPGGETKPGNCVGRSWLMERCPEEDWIVDGITEYCVWKLSGVKTDGSYEIPGFPNCPFWNGPDPSTLPFVLPEDCVELVDSCSGVWPFPILGPFERPPHTSPWGIMICDTLSPPGGAAGTYFTRLLFCPTRLFLYSNTVRIFGEVSMFHRTEYPVSGIYMTYVGILRHSWICPVTIPPCIPLSGEAVYEDSYATFYVAGVGHENFVCDWPGSKMNFQSA